MSRPDDDHPHYAYILLFRLTQIVRERKMHDRCRRLISASSAARMLVILKVEAILSLTLEGSRTESLIWRIVASDSYAVIILLLMTVSMGAALIEWGRFVFGSKPPHRRHLHALPYVIIGIGLIMMAGATMGNPPDSPALVINWLLSGFVSLILGIRVAMPMKKILVALDGH